MSDLNQSSTYELDDPVKIQGRDDFQLTDRSLAALRLRRALDALGDGDLKVLNPGSGAGRYARAIARYRPQWEVVGGDLSRVAIDEAIAADGGPQYVVLDAEAMPFEDGAFDAVVFFDLLEHVPHPDRMLGECARVLKPGGVLHFFVPLENQPGSLYRLLGDDRPVPIHKWKLDHVGHIQRFTDTDVLRLVWEAGFAVMDVAYSFHLLGQIHDIVDYWHRERTRGGHGLLPVPFVDALVRAIFVGTWRLSYIEDRLYSGPALASGLHVTGRKRP